MNREYEKCPECQGRRRKQRRGGIERLVITRLRHRTTELCGERGGTERKRADTSRVDTSGAHERSVQPVRHGGQQAVDFVGIRERHGACRRLCLRCFVRCRRLAPCRSLNQSTAITVGTTVLRIAPTFLSQQRLVAAVVRGLRHSAAEAGRIQTDAFH